MPSLHALKQRSRREQNNSPVKSPMAEETLNNLDFT